MNFRSLIASTIIAAQLVPMTAYAQQSIGRDVTIELSPRQTTVAAGEQVLVDVFVRNPSKRTLTSVETLFAYDVASLKGVNVTYPSENPFEMNLLSSGEAEFDATAGQVRLSRATLKDTSLINDTNYPFATMTFEGIGSTGSTSIDFVKTVSGLDRVTANATIDGISTNIVNSDALTNVTLTLSSTRSSAATTANDNGSTSSSGSTVSNIFGSSNSNTATTNTNATTQENTNSVTTTNTNTNAGGVFQNTNSNFATLSNANSNAWSTVTPGSTTNVNTNTSTTVTTGQEVLAPRDVAIKKQGKNITLYWTNQPSAQSTYIYYGTAADSFKTRKLVTYPSSSFQFSSMPTRGTYYFVLTHVDQSGRETPYTPMFVVDAAKDGIYYENDSYVTKITDKGSLGLFEMQTTAVSEAARASLALVPSMPENGPAEMLILLLIVSLGGAAFLSTRRHALV